MCLYPQDLGLFAYKNNVPRFVPCGHCVECLEARASEWALRVMDEVSLTDSSCMITLTYRDAPEGLKKAHLQQFIKDLRKRLDRIGVKIRYFGCGEYGSKGGRPHYHVIIFGWQPSDIRPFFKRKGHDVYISNFVSEVWKKGYITVEAVTYHSAKYCAKYLQKFSDVGDKQPPFVLMSLKPGIGAGAIDLSKIRSDGKIVREGKEYNVPRYYRKVIERARGDYFKELFARRLERSRKVYPDFAKLELRRQKVAKFSKKLSRKLLTSKEERAMIEAQERKELVESLRMREGSQVR